MISWDRNTRDRILPLLSSPCKPSDTNLHFGSGYMRFLDLNLYCSGCSGESQYIVSTIWCATPSPKRISEKGFSAAWQFLLKMSLIFITETSVWDTGVECPTSHPATGMPAWPVCQPGWPVSVGGNGWDSFPRQLWYLGQAPCPELPPGKSWTVEGSRDSHLQLATDTVGKHGSPSGSLRKTLARTKQLHFWHVVPVPSKISLYKNTSIMLHLHDS